MKIIVDEKNRITGYIEIGEIKGSIEVENFDFIYPVQDYIYKNGEIKYSPDIGKIKKNYENKFKEERQQKIDGDLEYKGNMFQMRENEDIKNFEQRAIQIALGKINLNDKEKWRLKDNTFKEFTIAELLEVADLWGARKRAIWKDFERICKEIEEANNIKELEAIEWSI